MALGTRMDLPMTQRGPAEEAVTCPSWYQRLDTIKMRHSAKIMSEIMAAILPVSVKFNAINL